MHYRPRLLGLCPKSKVRFGLILNAANSAYSLTNLPAVRAELSAAYFTLPVGNPVRR